MEKPRQPFPVPGLDIARQCRRCGSEMATARPSRALTIAPPQAFTRLDASPGLTAMSQLGVVGRPPEAPEHREHRLDVAFRPISIAGNVCRLEILVGKLAGDPFRAFRSGNAFRNASASGTQADREPDDRPNLTKEAQQERLHQEKQGLDGPGIGGDEWQPRNQLGGRHDIRIRDLLRPLLAQCGLGGIVLLASNHAGDPVGRALRAIPGGALILLGLEGSLIRC